MTPVAAPSIVVPWKALTLTSFQTLVFWRKVRARGLARRPFDRLVDCGLADWMPVEGQSGAADFTLTAEGVRVAARQAQARQA